MQLQDILYTQGFGTRRACVALIEGGAVTVGGQVCCAPAQDFDVAGLAFTVLGQEWPYQAKAYLMMHKPAGTECSHKPGTWPSVYSLLPMPLRLRPQKGGVPGVQAVGRLDQDTTGLLLLTDDGALIHRLNSPRHHVPKVYEVVTTGPVDDAEVGHLLEGVMLNGETRPVRASACTAVGTHVLATHVDRRQVSPGQAHGGGRRQPGRGIAPFTGGRARTAAGTCAGLVSLAAK